MDLYLAWYDDNTMRIELRALRKYTAVDTTEYLNTATVTATVTDLDEIEISGETWPLTLTYEAGSNGDYSVACTPDVSVDPGDKLLVEITAIDGTNQFYSVGKAVVKARTNRVGNT